MASEGGELKPQAAEEERSPMGNGPTSTANAPAPPAHNGGGACTADPQPASPVPPPLPSDIAQAKKMQELCTQGESALQVIEPLALLTTGMSVEEATLWKPEVTGVTLKFLRYWVTFFRARYTSIANRETPDRVRAEEVVMDMVQMFQKVAELLSRMYYTSSSTWTQSLPKPTLKLIVAIELVKAIVRLRVNTHLVKDFISACRGLFPQKGTRSSLRIPLVVSPGSLRCSAGGAAVPPISTVLDVLQPIMDLLGILRPLIYASLLLRFGNARRWRPIFISIAFDLLILLVSLRKNQLEEGDPIRTARIQKAMQSETSKLKVDPLAKNKVNSQLRRLPLYLLQDPIYGQFVQSRMEYIFTLLQSTPLIGPFFTNPIVSWQLRRQLYFSHSQ